MRSRFSGLSEVWGLKARETATRETFARWATISAVALPRVLLASTNGPSITSFGEIVFNLLTSGCSTVKPGCQ
jgi:hypothetical protein